MNLMFLLFMCSLGFGSQPKDELNRFCDLLSLSAGDDWSWQFEKADEEKNPQHPYLKAGTFVGTLTLKKNSASFDLLIYRSTKHDVFPTQIQEYHRLASCFETGHEAFSKGFICIDAAYIFLPMHPCWDKDYGTAAKQAIANLDARWNKK